MADIFELPAQTRAEQGTQANRHLRRADQVPGVVYGAHKDSTPITLAGNVIRRALQNEAFYSHILTLTIDGKPEKVVLKDIQHHPFRPIVMHMDFQRVSATEKLTMRVPLHYIGEDAIHASTDEAMVVNHMVTEVEIRCLPADLPEFIAVDVSKLTMGHSLHLADLQLPKGVEFATVIDENHDKPIISVQHTRVEEEPETPVAEIAADQVPASEQLPQDDADSDDATSKNKNKDSD